MVSLHSTHRLQSTTPFRGRSLEGKLYLAGGPRNTREMTPDYCPVCGADVPPRARACPECGADEQTGWSEKGRYDSMGIPDDEDFDYNEFVEREFEGKRPKRKLNWLWMAVAILLLILFVLVFVP